MMDPDKSYVDQLTPRPQGQEDILRVVAIFIAVLMTAMSCVILGVLGFVVWWILS